MDTTTRIAALRARQAKIAASARERIATIATKADADIEELETKIATISTGPVSRTKVEALEAEADAIATEDAAAAQVAALARAEAILETRKKMVADGDEIYVPRDAAEMLQILDAMEAGNNGL